MAQKQYDKIQRQAMGKRVLKSTDTSDDDYQIDTVWYSAYAKPTISTAPLCEIGLLRLTEQQSKSTTIEMGKNHNSSL